MAVLGSLSPFGSLGSIFGGLGLQQIGPPAPEVRTLRQAIDLRLSTDATLTSLVGGRIYPAGLPQDRVYPAISIVQAGTYEPRTLTRSTLNRSARIRISCWATSQEAAEDVAEAVRARLVDFRGRIGQMIIGYAGCENEWDLPEKPTGGSDSYIYQIILDLKFWSRKG